MDDVWTWVTIIIFLILPFSSIIIDMLASLLARKKQYVYSGITNDDFTLLVPIYGNIKYLENVEFLSHYGVKVVLCTTGDESKEFYDDLQALADKYAFQIFRDLPLPKDKVVDASKKRSTSGTTRDRLIRKALALVVTTKYVVPIDADSTASQPIGSMVGELAFHEWDIASVRLVLSNKDESIITKLQYHEYIQTMQLRYIAPWMLSGACHVARTEVLMDIMNNHSLFFQGNDMEIGLIAVTRGYKVGHIPFEVATSVPAKMKGFFRQRLAWSGGEFRLFITNIKFTKIHPLWWIYGGILTILLFPFRWLQLLQPNILVIFAIYSLLVYLLHIRTRDRWVLLMPLYDLCSSLIISPLGIIWYFKTVIKEKHFGYIRPHRHDSVRDEPPKDELVPPRFPIAKKPKTVAVRKDIEIPKSLR